MVAIPAFYLHGRRSVDATGRLENPPADDRGPQGPGTPGPDRGTNRQQFHPAAGLTGGAGDRGGCPGAAARAAGCRRVPGCHTAGLPGQAYPTITVAGCGQVGADEFPGDVPGLIRTPLGEVTEDTCGLLTLTRADQLPGPGLDLLGFSEPLRLGLIETLPHPGLALRVCIGVGIALDPVQQRLEPPPQRLLGEILGSGRLGGAFAPTPLEAGALRPTWHTRAAAAMCGNAGPDDHLMSQIQPLSGRYSDRSRPSGD